MHKKLLLVALLLTGFAVEGWAQGSGLYTGGMKMKLNDEGTKYIRFITWHQFWLQFTDMNPGTIDARGQQLDNGFNIGLRRSRFLTYSQLTDRFLVLMHVGINNQSFTNGGGSGTGGIGGYGAGKKPQVFIHDAWTEYTFVPTVNPTTGEKNPFSLSFGTGLHYWHGISRKTNASTLNFMTLDAPIFNWPTIELTDQFARQFGMYVKGKAGKFDYRAFVNKPFNTNNSGNLNQTTAVNIPTNNLSYGGYLEYEFLDQEGDLLPYKVGTWLGTKRVFNLGFGAYVHPEASGVLNEGVEEFTGDYDQVALQDHVLLGFDAFVDMPFGTNGMAFTGYGVFYNYNFGDNYLRNVGILNYANGGLGEDLGFAGSGNREPLIGTGNIFYGEFGLLLPELPVGGKFQPYLAGSYRDFEALEDPANTLGVGLNYYIEGHHAKVTGQYTSRPLFDTDGNSDGRAGEFIVQTHIFL